MEEIIRIDKDWISIVLMCLLLLLVFLKFRYGARLYRTNFLFISKSYLISYFKKDRDKYFSGFQVGMFVFQVFVLAFILLQAQLIIKNDNSFIVILIGVVFYFILRFLLGFLMAKLLELETVFNKILFDKTNYLSNTLLWIFPLVIVTIYTVNYKILLIKTMLIFLAILLIYRYVLLLINNKMIILKHMFYFILYLCAFEIAPLILIIKLTI